MKIENVRIGEITPYKRNAKRHPPEQVEHIANSIQEFGFRRPLVIDKDGVLVIGHGRLLAAQLLGMETVPCVRADDLTDAQIAALRLADNKTNESDWDDAFLDMELDDLDGVMDMSLFGFEREVEDLIEDAEDEDGEENPTSRLPESKVYVFCVSSFGTGSECFVEGVLSAEEAARLSSRLKEVTAEDVAAKLREALNAV